MQNNSYFLSMWLSPKENKWEPENVVIKKLDKKIKTFLYEQFKHTNYIVDVKCPKTLKGKQKAFLSINVITPDFKNVEEELTNYIQNTIKKNGILILE